MPFAPKIRKDILHALEHYIIPVLQTQRVPQLYFGSPFDFEQVEHWTLQEELLPDNDKGPLQIVRGWPRQQLVASRGHNISFLYEGSMHVKVGVLASMGKTMAKQGLAIPPGISLLKVSAPAIAFYSTFVAREDGQLCPEQACDVSKTMSIIFDREEVLLFHSSRNFEERASSHHLALQDPLLLQLGHIYHQELQEKVSLPGAQAVLSAIMFRLQHHLVHTRPNISNSCWPDPVNDYEKPLSPTELRHQALCHDVIDYVQNHLHQPLSLEAIAKRFHVSTFQLNRVFRQVHGTTVMHYVSQMRINVAMRLLAHEDERINDIARLIGFSSVPSFCTVFRRHTGKTPNQFRKQHQ